MKTDKQTYQLVMLPTKKASEIYKYEPKDHNDLLYLQTEKYKFSKNIKPQYLYLTSDDSIKKNDWYYNPVIDLIQLNLGGKAQEKIIKRDGGKKIVASTDKSMTPNHWIDLSKSKWITDYYNEKRELPEIALKLGYTINKSMGHFHQEREYFIKTNTDNSVIIIEPKKLLYTHNDVAYHIHSVLSDVALHILKTGKIDGFDSDKWIEENIK